MYEIIDHTADVGIRVRGGNQEEIFVEAAKAMFDLMVASNPNLIPSISVPIEISANNMEDLLVKWLQEILYFFDTRHLVFSHFYIDQLSETKIIGSAKGLKFDRTKHEMLCQIKAVTYHHLKLEQMENDWLAEVIFDI